MNKKKLFAIALAVCLIAILSFTTLAWFTDTDEVTNTFTVGSIKVQQNEWDQFGSPFVQNQIMIPVVNVNTPSNDPNYIHKVVTVSNKGLNDAYVRTHIAVDKRLKDYLVLDLNVPSEWIDEGATDIGNYTVYTFTYQNVLGVGATTPTLLKGVYLKAEVDIQRNPASNNLEFCMPDTTTGGYSFSGYAVQDAEGNTYPVNVQVMTQAVQSSGFNNADTALDSAFGSDVPNFG